MFKTISLLVVLYVSFCTADVQVQDKVSGDSTVGGFHFLEIHSGTAELGLKLAFFVLLIGLLVYAYMRYRARISKRKRLLGPLYNQLSTTSPADILALIGNRQAAPRAIALAPPAAPPPSPVAQRPPRCQRCRFQPGCEDDGPL